MNPLFDNPILFTLREFDAETGLYYHRARYLDPSTGRWITQDLLRYAAGDPNLYRYVGNGPLTSIDPWGLEGNRAENAYRERRSDAWYDWASPFVIVKGCQRLGSWLAFAATDQLDAYGYSSVADVTETIGSFISAGESVTDAVNPNPISRCICAYHSVTTTMERASMATRRCGGIKRIRPRVP